MDFEAMERVQQRQCRGIPCRWMGDTRFWEQLSGWILHATTNYKRYGVTSKNSSECQRLIANMKKQRTDNPSCPCCQIWLLGCDDLFRWQRCFCNVTLVSIQGKCSFNQTIWNKNYGEAYWPCKVCGHFWYYLGKLIFHCPFSHRMWHSIFVGHGKISIFIFLTSNKEIMDDSHDLDQN